MKKTFNWARDLVLRVLRVPPEKGLKYVGLQFTQAGVGIVGFRKMEEHLSSRRPNMLQGK